MKKKEREGLKKWSKMTQQQKAIWIEGNIDNMVNESHYLEYGNIPTNTLKD